MAKEDIEASVWERNPWAGEDLTVKKIDQALGFLDARWDDILMATAPYNVVEKRHVVGSSFLCVGTVKKAFSMARREAQHGTEH